ncbi:MAG: VWA domain-containing protein [Methylibium sp.]
MLPPTATAPLPGHLAANVMHFARVLRSAGLPVGQDRVQLALRALPLAGLASRRDFHATLQACFVARPEQHLLFDQAFHLFWRDPDLMGRMMAMLLPRVQGPAKSPPPPENRRLAAALFPPQPQAPRPDAPPPQEQLDIEATLTWSDRELLRKADFDTMTADEWREAQRLLQALEHFAEPLRTRRMRPATRPGQADWRATVQAMARHGDGGPMHWRTPRTRPAPLVVLADISGSMSRYSRMLLHFAHAMGRSGLRVHSFVFGTRLTPISRLMAQRDPDLAVAQVVRRVDDWSGGTRITACLHDFNRHWSRRVLGGGATLLLISDGLEHGDTDALRFEMERLHKSCRRLVWLNPLLRYAGFEPRAAGIRAMLPHVDHFLPAHNLDSLADLARVLATAPAPRRPSRAGPSLPLPVPT